jgi:hypothetical protein
MSHIPESELRRIVVVGEYATSSGPYLDDYFLVLINSSGEITEVPMGQARDAIGALEEILGTRFVFRLNNVTELAS